MKFEWDAAKAKTNLEKHGIAFEEAATIFFDVHGLEIPDEKHSSDESRSLRLGMSLHSRILLVVYTERTRGDHEEIIRIISARKAGKKERSLYFGRI